MEMYGYSGKMQRLEFMHKFLWYLLYDHQQENPVATEPLDPTEYQFTAYTVKSEDGDSLGAGEGNQTNGELETCDPSSSTSEEKKKGDVKWKPTGMIVLE